MPLLPPYPPQPPPPLTHLPRLLQQLLLHNGHLHRQPVPLCRSPRQLLGHDMQLLLQLLHVLLLLLQGGQGRQR